MFFSKTQPSIGLDISQRQLKACLLQQDGKQTKLLNLLNFKIPKKYIINYTIQEKEKTAELIHSLIKKLTAGHPKTNLINLSLPEQKTFIKNLEIKISQSNEIKKPQKIILKHLQKHIPLPSEEITFDWQITKKTKNKLKIMVAAAPKKIVKNYLETIELTKLIPQNLELEAVATHRALISAAEENNYYAIMDIGRYKASLIVCTDSEIIFTHDLPFLGVIITQHIKKNLDLKLKQAEKIKKKCGLNNKDCDGIIIENIIKKDLTALTQEVNKAYNFLKERYATGAKIGKILLTGGGAKFSGLPKFLSQTLSIPCQIGNSLANINNYNKELFTSENTLIYTTAIGLALKNKF